MFEREQLVVAVDLQKRSYRLLLWLSDAIARGFINFEPAHEYSSLPISTAKWIESHYENIPPDARPDIKDLEVFSNFFSTYLENSFDLVSAPGKMGASDWCCSFCNVMTEAPHLKTKKTTRSDKKKARKMRVEAIERLAVESGFRIDSGFAENLADNSDMYESTSLVAYGLDLQKRLKGYSSGGAVLILWRGFAWTSKGSPKKRFELNIELFMDAEQRLMTALAK